MTSRSSSDFVCVIEGLIAHDRGPGFAMSISLARAAGRSLASRGVTGLQLQCARTITTTGRVTAATQQDSLRQFSTGIPVGASPQLLISAVAPHRNGASMDIAAEIFGQGASIASTKKVMLENHFCMLISVWTDKDPWAVAAALTTPEVTSRLGFAMDVKPLTGEQIAEAANVEAALESGQKRRLKLTCPQKPGIVLAITELLKDQDCRMSEISADTMAKGSEIWFEIEAIIDLPPGVDAEGIESSLRFWTSKDSRSELIFDTFTQQVTPFSHA